MLTSCYLALGQLNKAQEMALALDSSYAEHLQFAGAGMTMQCAQCWQPCEHDEICSCCGSGGVPLGSLAQDGWDGGWAGGRARNHILFAKLLQAQSKHATTMVELEKGLAAARSSDAYSQEVGCLQMLAKCCLQHYGHANALQWLNLAFQKSSDCNSFLRDEDVRATISVIARQSWEVERILWIGNLKEHPLLSTLDGNLVRHISVFAGFRGEWAGLKRSAHKF